MHWGYSFQLRGLSPSAEHHPAKSHQLNNQLPYSCLSVSVLQINVWHHIEKKTNKGKVKRKMVIYRLFFRPRENIIHLLTKLGKQQTKGKAKRHTSAKTTYNLRRAANDSHKTDGKLLINGASEYLLPFQIFQFQFHPAPGWQCPGILLHRLTH